MSDKINILYITDGLTSGGKERQLVEIIKNINKDKFNIGVISFNANQHYSELVKSSVGFFVEINKTNKFLPFIKTYNCIKQFNPNIIHTWDLLADIYAFLPIKLLRINYVNGSIRDAGIEKGWQKAAKIFFLNYADIVFANSLAGLKAYNVDGTVIYNVINKKRFQGPYLGSEFNIIMVASFTAYKDYMTYIKAAALLLENNIVDKVYLIGDGSEKAKYIEFIKLAHSKNSHKFIFTGVVHNVEDYLAQCKVGVLCSTSEFSEGLSNSILEYLAAGVVAIVTNIGGSCEIISDNMNGYLIKEKSVSEIYNKVSFLKNNREIYQKLQECGYKTIDEKFSSKSNMQKIESIYISTLN